MRELQIWDPIKDLLDFDDFWSFPRRALGRVRQAFDVQQMPIEISEENGNIIVRAKIPGASKDDIKVSLTNDSLTICYKKEEEKKDEKKDEKGRVVHYSEFRSLEEITRTISLPKEVDSDKAKAEVKNGILTISAPILSLSREKTLEIKGD